MADPDTRQRNDLLHNLEMIASQIETVQAKLDRLYAMRQALFVDGRAMGPPLSHRLMAAAAGVTPAAVTQQLKKAAADG